MRTALRAVFGVAAMAWMAAFATVSARADELAETRNAIEAQYARLNAAIVAKELSALDAFVAPDAVFLAPNGGEMTFEQWRLVWERTAPALDAITFRTGVTSIVMEGEAAIVATDSFFEATLNQGGASVRMRTEASERDAWAKIGTQWRVRRSETIRSKTWIDGSLIQDLAAKPPLEPAVRDAVVSELRTRAIPFKTVAAGAGFDDLAALDALVGDARIVALGEATHGTAEFFRMKHRLFEYLVEKKGFTVFAFEANWPVVEVADRYVKSGDGSADAALKETGFWVWATEEVRDLLDWMRAYNAVPGRSRKLSFTGFDMQSPREAIACVIEAASKLSPAEAGSVRRLYDGFVEAHGRWIEQGMAGAGDSALDKRMETLHAQAADALKQIDAWREASIQGLTPEERRRARQCAAIVVQSSRPGSAALSEGGNLRDQAMAENVKWLAEEAFPDEKIVLWAHNAHVAAAPDRPGWTPMGQHLRRIFGERLLIAGFAFDRGEVRSIPLKDGAFDKSSGPIALRVPPAKPDSAEALFQAAGVPRFILDARAAPAAGPLGGWLAEPQSLRTIGAAYDHNDPNASYSDVALAKAFDLLIFIEESAATALLK